MQLCENAVPLPLQASPKVALQRSCAGRKTKEHNTTHTARSSNGRMYPSGGYHLGSSPSLAAVKITGTIGVSGTVYLGSSPGPAAIFGRQKERGFWYRL